MKLMSQWVLLFAFTNTLSSMEVRLQNVLKFPPQAVFMVVKGYIDWIVLRTILIVYVLYMLLTLVVRSPFCLS